MGIYEQASEVYADGPVGDPNDPLKHEIRALWASVAAALSDLSVAVVSGDAVVKTTRALLFADLAHVADTLGFVIDDPTPALNGIYIKSGGSGSGSWTLTDLALPSTFASELADLASDVAAITIDSLRGRVAIASATNMDIGAVPQDFLRVSGNVTVETLGTAPDGVERTLQASTSGGFILKNNGTFIIVPGGDISIPSSYSVVVRSLGGNSWRAIGGSAFVDRERALREADVDSITIDSLSGQANTASATNMDIASSPNDFLRVSGNVAVTSLGDAPAGVERTLQASTSGGFTLVNGSAIIVPGGDLSIPSAYSVVVRSMGGNVWRVIGGSAYTDRERVAREAADSAEAAARIAADALKAPLASPALTGTPTAPTAAPGTNNTLISTTAFVKAAVDTAVNAEAAARTAADALKANSSEVVKLTGNQTIAGDKTFTGDVDGITKAMVGLSSVDNISAASLRTRSTHTGTQSADTLTQGTVNRLYTKELHSRLAHTVSPGALRANSGYATMFSSSRSGGDPSDFPYIAPEKVVLTSEGEGVRLSGAAVQEVAARAKYAIEPSRIYRARWKYIRSLDPVDPSSDAVVAGLAWYTSSKSVLSSTNANVDTTLTIGSGFRVVEKIVARSAGTGIDIVAPANARFVTPFLTSWGSAQQTDMVLIGWEDITDVNVFAPDLDMVEGRVDALEGIDAGTRLTAIEAALPEPGTVRVRDFGDTTADVETALNLAVANGLLANFEQGYTYTGATLTIPTGARMIGDAYFDLDGSLLGADVSVMMGDNIKAERFRIHTPGGDTLDQNTQLMTGGNNIDIDYFEIMADESRESNGALFGWNVRIGKLVTRNIDRPIHAAAEVDSVGTYFIVEDFDIDTWVRCIRGDNFEFFSVLAGKCYNASANGSKTPGHNAILSQGCKYVYIASGLDLGDSPEHSVRIGGGQAIEVWIGVITVRRSTGCPVKVNQGPYYLGRFHCEGLIAIDCSIDGSSNNELFRLSRCLWWYIGFIRALRSSDAVNWPRQAILLNNSPNGYCGNIEGEFRWPIVEFNGERDMTVDNPSGPTDNITINLGSAKTSAGAPVKFAATSNTYGQPVMTIGNVLFILDGASGWTSNLLAFDYDGSTTFDPLELTGPVTFIGEVGGETVPSMTIGWTVANADGIENVHVDLSWQGKKWIGVADRLRSGAPTRSQEVYESADAFDPADVPPTGKFHVYVDVSAAEGKVFPLREHSRLESTRRGAADGPIQTGPDPKHVGYVWFVGGTPSTTSDVLTEGMRLTHLGELMLQGANVVFDANRLPVCRSFTIGTLPSAGTPGRIARASNARVFNGAGTMEGAGLGSGGIVEDNGAVWKIIGTNVTAVA